MRHAPFGLGVQPVRRQPLRSSAPAGVADAHPRPGVTQPTTGPSSGVPTGIPTRVDPAPSRAVVRTHRTLTPTTDAAQPTSGGKANFASDTGVTAERDHGLQRRDPGWPVRPVPVHAQLLRRRGVLRRAQRRRRHQRPQGELHLAPGRRLGLRRPRRRSTPASTPTRRSRSSPTTSTSTPARRTSTQKGVPDIGSQPISTYYYQYPNLFSIDGAQPAAQRQDLGAERLRLPLGRGRARTSRHASTSLTPASSSTTRPPRSTARTSSSRTSSTPASRSASTR